MICIIHESIWDLGWGTEVRNTGENTEIQKNWNLS